MPFGGSVKLTGESEYRQAIKNITQDLKSMSSALKSQSTDFQNNSKVMNALKGTQEKLTDSLKNQKSELEKAKSALAGYSVTLQGQQAKHNALTKEYKNAVIELEKIKKASGETSDAYKEQESVVDKLGNELADSTEEMNKSKSAMSDLQRTIKDSERTIANTQQAIDDLGDEAQDAGEQAEKGGDGFTVFKGVLADLASSAIQATIGAIKQLGGAIVDVGKQAYGSYANYEQLVGGVETLFGDSADILIEYAQNAYKTAGVSANEYMEQATSFSATLLQGLEGDTAKAVTYADMAIKDMSDNANKMGTDMYMIQNAYQGFAKDNYTMLDNLKLGYGGTQAEMARLINDSGVLGDAIEVTDRTVKNVPFDKIIEAIHVIQQNIGITGTTTLEAEKTIEGSTKAMQASWQNLLTGIADENQDISPLVDNFVEQVLAMAQNSAPRIKQIIQGFADLAQAMWDEVLPKIADEIPELKPLIDALTWIKDNSALIISAIAGITAGLMAFKVVGIITGLVSAFTTLFTLLKSGTGIIKALGVAFSANPIGLVVAGVTALVVAFVTLWNTSEGFRNFWIGLWENIKGAVMSAVETVGEWIDTAKEFLSGLWQSISDGATSVVQWLSDAWATIQETFSTVASWINDNVFQPIIEFFQPVITFFTEAWQIISQLAEGCWLLVKQVWEIVSTWFDENVIQPVSEFFSNLWADVTKFASDAWNGVKDTWKTVKKWFDDNIIQPVSKFFGDMWGKVSDGASEAWDGITGVFGDVADWFHEKFSNAWKRVKDVFSTGGEVFDGIKDGIEKAFKTVVNAIIRGINKVIAIPFNAINNTLDKIRGVEILGISPFKGLISRFTVPQIPQLAQGGILKKGQVGLLEGNGTEAVVPLEQNTQWTRRVASQISEQLDRPTQKQDSMTYDKMVNAFKDALSQMKVELDDEDVGKFIDKTVTRLVYN